MIKENFVKNKIKDNIPVIGTWNTLGSPLITEALASAKPDFLIIDFEHGPQNFHQIHNFVNACEKYDVSPLIRIPGNIDHLALQALDQGAHGIVVPHIETKEEAVKFVNYIKYHPLGTRGFTPLTKAGGFSANEVEKYIEHANNFTLGMIIIESLKGLENLDEILQVEGIDIIFFGSFDLSQALGHPGQTRHPKVLEVITEGIDKVNRANKCAGAYLAQSDEDISWLLKMNLKLIIHELDSKILHDYMSKTVASFNNIVDKNEF